MRPIVKAREQVGEKIRRKRMEGCAQPELGYPRHFRIELLAPEPRVGHVLVDMIVVLVVLVVTLRPWPEGHEKGGVAKVTTDRVDPRIVAERRVATVVSCV